MLFKKNVPGKFSIKQGNLSITSDVIKYVLVMGFIAWLSFNGTEKLGYNWQWFRIPKYFFSFDGSEFLAGPLLRGFIITLHITEMSIVLSLAIGLFTALLRLSNSVSGRLLARLYLEIIRNTPLLVQLFFIYFVISPILDIGRLTSAVVALSLFEGAYISEIFRAGILSMHGGQWEAAYSLGINRFHTYRIIILPQVLRRVLPSLTNQVISLIKDSALVSTIAIYDLTMEGRVIIAETYLTFEIWFTIAFIYLLLTASLSLSVNMMEKRLINN
ncbi:amino acid ABC transporter permease [Thermodesulfobacteriota bacterium]